MLRLRQSVADATFICDPTEITAREIADRLDEALLTAFPNAPGSVADWNVRWVESLADAPLFGAAVRWRRERSAATSNSPATRRKAAEGGT